MQLKRNTKRIIKWKYIFFFDYRIGFIVLLGTICYFFITSKMEKKSSMIAPKRQRSTAKLVEAGLQKRISKECLLFAHLIFQKMIIRI